MTLQSSRRLAVLAGIVLPLGETARRWHELGDPAMWLVWLDDWAIAAFLLYGAWRTRRDVPPGRLILAAAWGFACGLGYSSFVFSILSANPTDASGAPMWVAAVVKGLLLLLGILGLAGALRAQPPARSTAPAG